MRMKLRRTKVCQIFGAPVVLSLNKVANTLLLLLLLSFYGNWRFLTNYTIIYRSYLVGVWMSPNDGSWVVLLPPGGGAARSGRISNSADVCDRSATRNNTDSATPNTTSQSVKLYLRERRTDGVCPSVCLSQVAATSTAAIAVDVVAVRICPSIRPPLGWSLILTAPEFSKFLRGPNTFASKTVRTTGMKHSLKTVSKIFCISFVFLSFQLCAQLKIKHMHMDWLAITISAI